MIFRMKWLCIFPLLTLLACGTQEPTFLDQSVDKDCSIRAAALGTTEAWLSGNKGTVLYKGLGSASWEDRSPNGMQQHDFRSMQWVNDSVLLLATTTNPAIVLRSVDKGRTYEKVYHSPDSSTFFDAMVVDSAGLGFLLADPDSGRFSMFFTQDFGRTWSPLADSLLPSAAPGEVAFAAANSSMLMLRDAVLFVTGGPNAAYIHAGVPLKGQWKKELLGMYGSEACGAFTLARKGEDLMVAGGCYDQIERSEENMLFSDNMGTQWFSLPKGPKGYISDIEFVDDKFLVSVGDIGIQWAPSRTRNFTLNPNFKGLNVLACKGENCIAAGKKGKIVSITFQP